MDVKAFIIATIVGGISFFIISMIIYGVVMADFYQANAGTATGVMKEAPSFLSLFLGELAFGALYSYIFLNWANIRTFAGGAKGGAVIGLLLGLGFNLINFATSNLMTLTGHLTDAGISAIAGAITGGVIGFVIGRVSK